MFTQIVINTLDPAHLKSDVAPSICLLVVETGYPLLNWLGGGFQRGTLPQLFFMR